jgi:SAM-dependent methyltransferase
MHDTAFHIGTLAMNIYADLRTDSVLEIGSQSFNGSLRENALPTTRYVGIDIEEGEGVDLVAEPGRPFPVNDAEFDLVMATSVFEHDPCFWMTFLEMCRATKDGGYIYINAPSNGVVHRYPQDNWRFYPDSGRALAQWATSQSIPVILVESFIAGRENDIWNDFVAVFRKGPIKRTLPKVFIHDHLSCTDVITWKSKKIQNSSEKPEDLILLDRADKRARAAEEELARGTAERDSLAGELNLLRTRLTEVDADQQRRQAESTQLKNDLNLRESELKQRQEEIEQTRREVAQKQTKLDELAAQLSASEERLKNYEMKRLDAERRNADLQRLHQESSRTLRKVETERAEAQAEARTAEAKLADRFQELATLTQLLRQKEQHAAAAQENLEWLLSLHQRMMRRPKWWNFMPESWRRRREHERLQRSGLFDAGDYLQRYPDVAAEGFDPLDHYLRHGFREGRARAFRA